jgi:acetyl esterase/lipase
VRSDRSLLAGVALGPGVYSEESSLKALDNLPEPERRRFAEIGPVWGSDIPRHRDLVLQAYRPLLAAAPKSGVTVLRDIAYGADPRQVLDVYRHRAAARAPVVIFVHGGAFVRGDKDIDAEVYANVLYYFARHGFLGVNMEYRRAPEFKYPSGAQDVAAAVAWATTHAREHGGDPGRIFLVGHSAGGTHVASYAYDPGAQAPGGPAVSGIVLLSARLRADALPGNPNAEAVRAYFGGDESRYEQLSPVVHGARSSLPVFIAVAEYENPYLDVYGAELFYRIAVARGRAPRFVRMPRHNHISIVAHVNTEEDALGAEIREFLETEC